jgi:hypothetical protein
MSARNTIGRRLAVVAAMTAAGLYWTAAGAAVVHGGNTDEMAHWYGRAGGLTGSDAVSRPVARADDGPSVGVSYSADLAKWTNMPRDQAKEGPVTDSLSAPAVSEHAFIDHWYGRAGGLTGSDAISGPSEWKEAN